MTGGFSLFESRVDREWVDYNGHLRDAFYGMVFSYAIDQVMDEVGIDEAYRKKTRGTLYTLELHLFYLKEVKEGAPLLVESRILDADAKRIHLHQSMRHGTTGDLLSVQECMLLHVSQAGAEPKASPFPPDIDAKVMALKAAQDALPPPPNRAGQIGIRRKG